MTVNRNHTGFYLWRSKSPGHGSGVLRARTSLKGSLRHWHEHLGLDKLLTPFIRPSHARGQEMRLQSLQDELSATFESQSCGNVQLDGKKGRILKANRAFCALTGLSRGDLLGRAILDLAAEADRSAAKCGFKEAVLGLKPRWSGEFRLALANGRERWVKVSGLLLHADGASPARLLASFQDLSESRYGADQAREAEGKLQSSARLEAIGRAAGGAVHDLNNLMVSINGFAELIALRTDQGDKNHEYAGEISRLVARSNALGRRILDSERTAAEAGPRAVDLNALADSACAMLRGQMGENIRIAFMGSDNALRIQADPAQLERVLLNLISNARDAMPLGGNLAVRVFSRYFDGSEKSQDAREIPAGRYAGIEVHDSGHGMAPETLESLFKTFFTTKGARGTGLGLSMVMDFTARSGGYIQVSSAVGHGTLFRLLFPQAAVSEER